MSCIISMRSPVLNMHKKLIIDARSMICRWIWLMVLAAKSNNNCSLNFRM